MDQMHASSCNDGGQLKSTRLEKAPEKMKLHYLSLLQACEIAFRRLEEVGEFGEENGSKMMDKPLQCIILTENSSLLIQSSVRVIIISSTDLSHFNWI